MHKNRKNRYLIVVECFLGSIVITILIILFCFQEQLRTGIRLEKSQGKIYDKHYVMITQNKQSELWNKVYTSAKQQGEEENAYVEYIGNETSDDVEVELLMRTAIDCDVDGILLEANGSTVLTELIDEATAKEIPVVTLVSDSKDSTRKHHVGIDEEVLGRLYGELILDSATEVPQKILVLVDEEDPYQNQGVCKSIKDTLIKGRREDLAQQVETRGIDHHTLFGAEEAIRDIIVSQAKLPDIIICLNANDTRCLYQAVIDHNKVGQVKILGYYNGKEIVEAIKKDIIYGTVTIEPEQIGRLGIEALGGSVSKTEVTIDLQTITADNVEAYVEKP